MENLECLKLPQKKVKENSSTEINGKSNTPAFLKFIERIIDDDDDDDELGKYGAFLRQILF